MPTRGKKMMAAAARREYDAAAHGRTGSRTARSYSGKHSEHRHTRLVQHLRVYLQSVVGCVLLTACTFVAGCGGDSQAHTPGQSASAAAGAARASTGGAGATAARAVVTVDADADGLPDRAELHAYNDRGNFRRWFTAIAETQFYEVSREWNAEQRDCAGLVRFAWREALRRHDRPWLRRMGKAYEPFAPDVRAYTLETSPLGEKLFRTRAGGFDESDLRDGTFSEFADARTLRDYNAEFVGRDRRRAHAGDLLFFHQPRAERYPYHVMLFLGEARADGEGAKDWVVYHTGASAGEKGEVRKVRLSVLDEHPDARWRPRANNPNFLGFYRLKILQ